MSYKQSLAWWFLASDRYRPHAILDLTYIQMNFRLRGLPGLDGPLTATSRFSALSNKFVIYIYCMKMVAQQGYVSPLMFKRFYARVWPSLASAASASTTFRQSLSYIFMSDGPICTCGCSLLEHQRGNNRPRTASRSTPSPVLSGC